MDVEPNRPTPDTPTDEAPKNPGGRTPTDVRDFLNGAQERFKFCIDATDEQRRLEVEDLSFIDLNEQWPEAIKRERAGVPGKIPPRPCLTINKLKQPVLQITNAARMAHMGIQIRPRGEKAKKRTAEVFQGVIRNIEVESNAQVARIWALERAVKCGLGVYRILTDFANDGDFDQDILVKRVLNQGSVFLDPTAQEPDWSDGNWALIAEWFTPQEYKRKYPNSTMASLSDWQVIGSGAPGWVKTSGTGVSVLVAEYFYVEFVKKRLCLLQDNRVVPFEQVPPGVTIIDNREIEVRTVKWALINAVEILDERDWPGQYIPLVPIIGEEANVDGKRVFQGIVRSAKGAQESYNYMRSAQVESVALAPRAPWVMAEGQDEGYKKMWDEANTVSYTRLIYKPKTFGTKGELLPAPSRNVVEPAIQAITLAAHEADGDIKATTGMFDPSLGNLNPQDRSGKAIQALQKQGEIGSSIYMDNYARAIAFEARILLDLIPKVITRKGRITRMLGEDESATAVMLNQPFKRAKDGTPQPLAPGESPIVGETETIDLSDGAQYTVTVTVGKAFTTLREEGAAMVGDLIAAAPNMAPMIGDLWVGDMDFPGAKKIAARLKKALPPQLQDDDENPESPQALKQKLSAVMQQHEKLVQLVNAQSHTLETKQNELDHQALMEREKLASNERIAAYKLQLDTVKVQVDAAKAAAGIEQQNQAMQFNAKLDLLMAQFGHMATSAQSEQEHAQSQQEQITAASLAATQAGGGSPTGAEPAGPPPAGNEPPPGGGGQQELLA